MKTLSEKKVLKKLKIDDFRHLSKDTVMRFASSIHMMDPEVAKKALEQFPNFAAAVKDGIVEYKEVVKNVVDSGDKDHDRLLDMIDKEYDVLVKALAEDNLSIENKFRVMERIDLLQDRVEKANKDMRDYRLKIAGGLVGVLSIGFFALAAVLGGNSEITKNDDDDEFEV